MQSTRAESSAYHQWNTRRHQRETRAQGYRDLTRRVRQVFEDNRRVYGYRKMWRALKESDLMVSEYKVRRIMREAGRARRSRPRHIRMTGTGQRIAATVVAPSPWSTSTTSTAYTYGWEGTSLCWVRASSASAEARLTYLFDENERVYAASYESTRSGVSTSTVFRVLSTDRGDIVGLASGAGDVFAKYSYGPFGEMDSTVTTAVAGVSASLASEIAAANSLRYAGYQFDNWSGSYYLQARYYDPTTKQFISKDPAEADGEESTYQYCGGDPIGLVDPTGMWGFSFGGVFKAVRRTFSRARASANRAVSRVTTVARVAFKSVSRSVKAKVRKVRRWASAKKARVSHYYHRASKRFAKFKNRRARTPAGRAIARSGPSKRTVVVGCGVVGAVGAGILDGPAPFGEVAGYGAGTGAGVAAAGMMAVAIAAVSAATDAITEAAESRASRRIVLGRLMEARVIPYATRTGAEADYYQPTRFTRDHLPLAAQVAANQAWLVSKIVQGYSIDDVGTPRTGLPRSPFYDAEHAVLRVFGYPKYRRIDLGD